VELGHRAGIDKILHFGLQNTVFTLFTIALGVVIYIIGKFALLFLAYSIQSGCGMFEKG